MQVPNKVFMHVRRAMTSKEARKALYPTIDPLAACYLDVAAGIGYCINPDGEICHLLSWRGQVTRAKCIEAIARGGKYCRTFDGTRVEFFRRLGFVETAREKFDVTLAPDAWDIAINGIPDLVTMTWGTLL